MEVRFRNATIGRVPHELIFRGNGEKIKAMC